MSLEVEKELIFFKSDAALKKSKNVVWKKRLKFLMWFIPSSLIISNVFENEVKISNIIEILCYIASIFFMIETAFTFKEFSESKDEIALSKPITFMIVATLLMLLPTLSSSTNGVIVFNKDMKQNISHSNQTDVK